MRRNAKHAAQWGATLATYAEPIIGALPVQSIDTALVMKVLEQDVRGGPGKPAVPLSMRAITILEEMKRLIDVHDEKKETDTFVFPGGKRDRPLSNMAFLMLLRRMKRDDLTAHGFRSTFRDWTAERTNFPSEVAEMALAHTISSKVEQAYRRGDLFERRQRLMTAWSTYCTGRCPGPDLLHQTRKHSLDGRRRRAQALRSGVTQR